jgi:hypothetical protein
LGVGNHQERERKVAVQGNERSKTNKVTSSGDRLILLINRVSIGIVTTAILVIATLTTATGPLDGSLSFAVKGYFLAAAAASGGILFDSLVDSILTDVPGSRVRWYNILLYVGNVLWIAIGGVSWAVASGAVADHYGIDPPMQRFMLGMVLLPMLVAAFIAVIDSLLRFVHGPKQSGKGARRAQ